MHDESVVGQGTDDGTMGHDLSKKNIPHKLLTKSVTIRLAPVLKASPAMSEVKSDGY